jgi:hypothetical protein
MIYELLSEINTKVEELIENEFQEVTPEEIGLDTRAAPRLFINEEFIAVSKGNRRNLDYYGGFEYVDEEYITVIGDMVFYSAEDERVRDHLAEYYERDEENV